MSKVDQGPVNYTGGVEVTVNPHSSMKVDARPLLEDLLGVDLSKDPVFDITVRRGIIIEELDDRFGGDPFEAKRSSLA